MAAHGAREGRFRVVVLSRDPALASRLTGLCAPGIEIARVASGYEAGAEILADPAAAMVVDFRALGSAHGRLLDVARRMDVAMLGVGTLPVGMSTEGLSGIGLVSTADLPGALEKLAAAAAESAAPAEAPPSAPPAPEPPAPEPPRKKRARRKKAKKAAKRTPGDDAEPKADADAAAPAPPAEHQPRSAPPQSPSDLLTPEELTALLENEP